MNVGARYHAQRQRRQQRRRELIAVEPLAQLLISTDGYRRIMARRNGHVWAYLGEGGTTNQAWYDAWRRHCGKPDGASP